MWVRARDGGGLAGEAPVSVFVLGAGDAAPRVLAPPADLFLREDAAPGTLVAQLRADGAAPRYRLVPALWPRDLFAVDDAGRLVLSGQLDRETAAEHLIGECGYTLLHYHVIAAITFNMTKEVMSVKFMQHCQIKPVKCESDSPMKGSEAASNKNCGLPFMT